MDAPPEIVRPPTGRRSFLRKAVDGGTPRPSAPHTHSLPPVAGPSGANLSKVEHHDRPRHTHSAFVRRYPGGDANFRERSRDRRGPLSIVMRIAIGRLRTV